MSHLYVYSPSGAVRDRPGFKRAIKRLQALGHEVEIDPDALASAQRFAGDDATRLAAIGRAAASGAEVLLTSRGGYGLTRLLANLPYAAIQNSIERGSAWVGLSDFTALQLAVLAQTGGSTWAGPALLEDWAAPDPPDEIMQACFEDLCAGVGEGTGWRLPAADLRAHPELAHVAQAEGWSVEATALWGGNLSVLSSLVGTPYLPAIDGGILFLEDVGEHPYRIERMLSQLLHAGLLQRQRAIVLGAFNRFQLTPHDRGFKLASVLQWLRSQVRVPVLTGLPFGHVPTKVLLPLGRPVQLLVQGRDCLLFWG
ncbi:MAG: LD-carboxypeptidase [Serpentinimonas sp.]|nr:LD-carboxypeptidase [Serpentinimonas sp.]MDO9610306.1 LD-carboxypeptidase [Serpentinimonas sp.]